MTSIKDEIKNMSIEELKQNYKALLDLVHNIGCYGTRDLRMLELLENELLRREYQIKIIQRASISKCIIRKERR